MNAISPDHMPSFYTVAVESGYSFLSRLTPCSAWAHLQTLQKNQWLSPEALSALRWERLQNLLNSAYDSIPFYRRLWKTAGVDPRKFCNAGDMVHLPVVTKKELIAGQENDEFLLSRRDDFQYAHTSGTTGERFQVPFTFAGYQKKYANHLRQMYACGWRLGVKSATIHYSGHSQFKGRFSGREHDREPFMNLREVALGLAHRRTICTPYVGQRTGDDAQVQAWYDTLRDCRPWMLETMDYSLIMLKEFIERRGLPRLQIPRTFVLGTYSASLRARLEEFFDTLIFNRFSPHEIEGVAFCCSERQGMHMATDSYHIEFLDDRDCPVGPGEIGRIVITDLDNYLMPLIRYRFGDLGHFCAEPCACGRGFPLMGDIDGRERDLFSLENGHLVAPSHIAAVLQDEAEVDLFQVAQDRSGRIEARIVRGTRPLGAETAGRIERGLRALLGPDEELAIVPVDWIELEPNGKCSFVKREGHS